MEPDVRRARAAHRAAAVLKCATPGPPASGRSPAQGVVRTVGRTCAHGCALGRPLRRSAGGRDRRHGAERAGHGSESAGLRQTPMPWWRWGLSPTAATRAGGLRDPLGDRRGLRHRHDRGDDLGRGVGRAPEGRDAATGRSQLRRPEPSGRALGRRRAPAGAGQVRSPPATDSAPAGRHRPGPHGRTDRPSDRRRDHHRNRRRARRRALPPDHHAHRPESAPRAGPGAPLPPALGDRDLLRRADPPSSAAGCCAPRARPESSRNYGHC